MYWQARSRLRKDQTSRIKRHACPSEVAVTALQDLRERLSRNSAGYFIPIGGSPGVRRWVWSGVVLSTITTRCFWSSTAMSQAGICRAAGSRSARRFWRRCGANFCGGGTGRTDGRADPACPFFNGHVSRRDHVAVYIVVQFRQDRLPTPNHEIIDCGFYDATALPAETTQGTRLLDRGGARRQVADHATWR